MKKTNSEEQVLIGKVGSPAGLKGEVRITLYQHDSDNLKEGKVLLLEREGKNGMYKSRTQQNCSSASAPGENFAMRCGSLRTRVEAVRYQKGRPVVKICGIDDRNAAESILGMEVYIYAGDLEQLPEGEHYVRDLIGCRVIDRGAEIGILKDVIQNTAQSILEIETPEGKTVLVPAVDEFMRGIDESEGIIEVELIPGFL